MSIFTKVNNEKFFNPLCYRNKEIYFECINLLIEKSKELPILYEQDAKSCITIYLQNCLFSLETENIGEEISSSRSASDNAVIIIRYFRECGWITPKEIGRSGDNIATVSSDCRKVVEAFNRIFNQDVTGVITNHIFAIYEILKSSLEEESARSIRPYTNILAPLIENEISLKNELFDLKDNIRAIMRVVIKITEANSFGQYLIKDEILSKFFNDYFFIKRSGLIPGYIAGIDRMLNKIRNSDIYERMTEEYRIIKNIEYIEAREIIDKQFAELDSFINFEYEKEMTYIDRKINTYFNLFSTRILMVLSNNTNLQHYINNLLMQLKDMDEEERAILINALALSFRVNKIGYIGKKSFQRRKKTNENRVNRGIKDDELSAEEKEQLTYEILKETPDRYSMDNVKTFLSNLTFVKGKIASDEIGIRTRDDAMMVAAGIIYANTLGFPYRVDINEGFVETEVATISKLVIRIKDDE